MRPCLFAIALLVSPAVLAVQFHGIQTSATTWTYTVTFDPMDNFYDSCHLGARITLSGLSGVTAAGGPTGSNSEVLDGGTTVVWSFTSGGTGNPTTPLSVFGFTVTAANAKSGMATFATSGFVDGSATECSPPKSRDVAGLVPGPMAADPVITRVLPVVGSTAGSQGSLFKTSVQLYNPSEEVLSGKIVFHPQGASGSVNDPSLAYTIGPWRSVTYSDLLPAMGVPSGLGSADIVPDKYKGFPVVTARVFNDAGSLGTSGLAIETVNLLDALQKGNTGVVVAPADVQKFRMNIGIRTLQDGATVDIRVRGADGSLRKGKARSYGPTYFEQPSVAALLDGYVLVGGESISFEVTAGSAIIYGSTTDNITNDPSVQMARRVN